MTVEGNDPWSVTHPAEAVALSIDLHLIETDLFHFLGNSLYDKLFLTSNPGDLDEYLDNLNPDSLVVIKDCKLDADLAFSKVGECFQFMRNGYFALDKHSTEGNLIFNLTATLKDSFKVEAAK